VAADVRARATERVTVLRGTETNSYGDLVDSEVAVHTGVIMAIMETSRSRTFLPAEGATRVITSHQGFASSNADILKGDRLRSERTGNVYLVVDMTLPGSAAISPDLELQLSRTT
jgi:hypothetical protein